MVEPIVLRRVAWIMKVAGVHAGRRAVARGNWSAQWAVLRNANQGGRLEVREVRILVGELGGMDEGAICLWAGEAGVEMGGSCLDVAAGVSAGGKGAMEGVGG